MAKNYIEEIDKAGKAYALAKKLRDDSEVEVNNMDGRICICDYSESRGSAEFIADVCFSDDVTKDEIIELCNKRHWAYCL